MCNMYVCTACRPVCEFIYLQLHTLQGVLTVYRIYLICLMRLQRGALVGARDSLDVIYTFINIVPKKVLFRSKSLDKSSLLAQRQRISSSTRVLILMSVVSLTLLLTRGLSQAPHLSRAASERRGSM